MNHTATPPAETQPNEATPWPKYPAKLQQWVEWTERYPFLRFLCDRHGNESPPPAPMKRDELARLVGSLRDAHHREVLQLLLVDLLIGPIKKLLDAGVGGIEP